MVGDHENDDLYKEIIDTLDEAVRLGLVEVVGIRPDGEWLYAATDECKKMFAEQESFEEIVKALEALENNKQAE